MPDQPSAIQLFNESGKNIPIDINDLNSIVTVIAEGESSEFTMLEVVFVDEEEILRINRAYLEHDYITDIITFDYDEGESESIEGTLYCCAAKIYEQAIEHNQDPVKEFSRIVIHGLLHLCGYKDSSDDQKKEMRDKENYYLNLSSI